MSRLAGWLWRRLWPRISGVWTEWALLGALAGLAGISLDDAVWLEWLARPGWAVWPGLLCGLLLARTHWPGWFAGLYALALSLAAGLQAVGQWLPSAAHLRGQTWLEALLLIHARLDVLGQRLGGWLELARRGLPNYDSGLVYLILLLLGWNACAWLAFQARRGRVFAGLLPAWLLLAIIGNASGQSLWLPAYFTLIGLVLMALAHYRGNIASWERRRVDYPDELGFDWIGAAAALALAVMLLARAAPLASTPEGWRQVREWFEPEAEPAQTAQHPRDDNQNLLAAAAVIDLSLIGQPPPESDATVLWVGTSDPAPPPPQSGLSIATIQAERHYWRGGILSTYTGRGWQPAGLDLRQDAALAELGAGYAGRRALDQTFELPGGSLGMLFAANEPLRASGAGLYAAEPDGSLLAVGSAARYQVISWVPAVEAGALRAAPPQLIPADVLAAYTQLPAGLPGRVRELAARITTGAETHYDQALAVQSYLRLSYAYNLEGARPKAGQDAVDSFLFETRAGSCGHFASAMAVLLRAQGVPARVALGYLQGEYDYDRGMYRVPASAAHAWVEVYFSGYGWIEFEPTPAFPAPEYGAPVFAGDVQSTGPAPRPERANLDWLPGALGVLAGIGVLVLILIGLVQYRRDAARKAGPAARLYWRLRRVLAWGGLAAPGTVTPLEFLAQCRADLSGYPRLIDAAERITADYLREAFSAMVNVQPAVALGQWRAVRWELAAWVVKKRITTEAQHPDGRRRSRSRIFL